MSEVEEAQERYARNLVRELIARHPIDAARALSGVDREELAELVFEQAPPSAAELLRRLNPDDAAEVLAKAPPEQTSAVVPFMEPTLVADLLNRVDEETRPALLERMPRTLAKELDQILTFPPGSAGKLMDSRATRFLKDETVGQALERLRRVANRRIMDLMLVDVDGRLEAVVPLHLAAGAELDTPLGELAKGEPVFVYATTPSEDVVELLEKHHLASLPVVDLDRVLIGVISYDALLKAAQQDAAADAQAMVGVSRHERALSSPWEAIKSRMPWLQINLASAFVASSVVGVFDHTIAKVTALAVLMPIVAGEAGNTGAQALAVTQRGLALREIRTTHVWRLMRKEALVGACNGIAIGIVTALGVLLWSKNLVLSGVIFAAMVLSMAIASISGVIIPIVLTALGRDPATASSILLTAITDTVAFLSFLGLATALVQALLAH